MFVCCFNSLLPDWKVKKYNGGKKETFDLIYTFPIVSHLPLPIRFAVVVAAVIVVISGFDAVVQMSVFPAWMEVSDNDH